MRDIRQIISDNGGDNTPALDTHNLTGRVVLDPYNAEMPLGVEPLWTPLDGEDEDFASLDDVIDCE